MRLCLIVLMALVTSILVPGGGVAGSAVESDLAAADRLAQEGHIDAALAAYRALSNGAPQTARLHARVAGMLLLKQDYAAAIGRFQKAIGLDHANSGEAFIGLGLAYLHLGQYGPARAALGEARRLKPASAPDIDELLAWLDARNTGPQLGSAGP